MNEAQKLQKELNEMNAKRKQVIKENSVAPDLSKSDRGYTYRPSTEF